MFLFSYETSTTDLTIFEYEILSCDKGFIFLPKDTDYHEIPISDLLTNEYSEELTVSFLELPPEEEILIEGILENTSEYKKAEKSTSTNQLFYTNVRYKIVNAQTHDHTFEYLLFTQLGDLDLPSRICKKTLTTKTCFNSCAACEEEGNERDHKCLHCKEGLYFMENTRNCVTLPEKKYFIDEADNTIKRCFSKCVHCQRKGSEEDHQCTRCENTFVHLSFYTGEEEDRANCVKICNLNYSNWYLKGEGSNLQKFQCTNEKNYCPLEYLLVNNKTRECKNKCNENEVCFAEIEKMPDAFIQVIIQNKTLLNLVNRNFKNSTFGLEIYFVLNHHLLFYEGDSSANHERLLYLNNCEEALRKHYKVDNSTKLKIVQVTKITEKKKTISFDIFADGVYLDMNICDNREIILKELNNNTFAFKKVEDYLGKGISIYDKSDEFFNDYCEPYSVKLFDVNIFDRRRTYYLYIDVCMENFDYLHYDFVNERVQCSYNPGKTFFQYQRFVSVPSYNHKLIKCYKIYKKFSNFFNLGFIIMGSLFITEIFCIVLVNIFKEVHFLKYTRKEAQKRIPFKFTSESNNKLRNESSDSNNLIEPSKDFMRTAKDPVKKSSFFKQKPLEPGSVDIYEDKTLIIITKIKKLSKIKEIMRLKLKRAILFCVFHSKGKKYQKFFKFIFVTSVNFGITAFVFTDYDISEMFRKQKLNYANLCLKIILSVVIGNLIISLFSVMFPTETSTEEEASEYYPFVENKGMKKFLKILYFAFLIAFNIFMVYFVTIFCYVYPATRMTWVWCSVVVLNIQHLGVPIFVSVAIRILDWLIERNLSPLIYSISDLLFDI